MSEPPAEPAAPRLDGLASLLPAFEAADSGFGEMRGGDEAGTGSFMWPSFSPSELTLRFLDVAYGDGWVRPDFDWPAWAETPEAQRLRDDRSALEEATVLDLARLLTVVIRQDRFVEGTLAEALETGLITAALRRVDRLRRER